MASHPPVAARRTGRPSLAEAGEIEERILSAAAELFLRQGASVPMRAIVEASGLSSKTVYARYAGKADLIPAALRHVMRRATTNTPAIQPTDDIEGALADFIRRSAEAAYQPETLAVRRLLLADLAFAKQLSADIGAVVTHVFITPLATFLAAAHAAGHVRDIDVELTARALTTLILGGTETTLRGDPQPPSPDELVRWSRAIARLFTDGIRA